MSSNLHDLVTSLSNSNATPVPNADPEPKMSYTRLGTSGLKISRVILGAMSYGNPWTLPSSSAVPLLHHAYKLRALTNDVVESGKVSMQNYHNLIYREEEREMHPYCDFAGIGLILWSLSPSHRYPGARPRSEMDATKRAQLNQYLAWLYSDANKAIVDRVEEVRKQLGQSMASVAIAWSLQKGVNPILGLNSIERIDEAVGAVNLHLSEENVAALEEPYKARSVAPMW